uniref:Phosphoglycerate mutase family protein n=1 Tax=Bionectria ochroleuca TaxID=29856 RepID=A0A0B7K7N4_BIOOC
MAPTIHLIRHAQGVHNLSFENESIHDPDLTELGLSHGDAHVAAVSHGGFLHFLTDDWHGIPTGSATGWANCQFRSYQFVDPTGQDDEAELVETAESWRRRQGDQIPPTRTELREMRAVVQEDVIPYLYIKK